MARGFCTLAEMRHAPARHRLSSATGTFCVGALFFLLCAIPFFGFVPIWDGAAYFLCVLDAVQKPFNLYEFHCANHLSLAYMLTIGLTQYVDFANVKLAYAVNIALHIASAWFLFLTIRHAYPKRDAEEAALGSLAYLFAPLAVIHLFQVNLDSPMTAAFVVTLYCTVTRRYALAGLAGLGVVFSKETGVGVYCALMAAYGSVFMLFREPSLYALVRHVKKAWGLFIPFAALGTYYGLFGFFAERNVTWVGNKFAHLYKTLTDVSLYDEGFRAFLLNIYVLNFQWILTAFLVACAALHVARVALNAFAKKKKKRHLPLPSRDTVMLVLLLILLTYITTRIRPWNNARYVLVNAPVLTILGTVALQQILPWRRARVFALVALLGLLVVSNFRTIDPVSRRAYGTFAFGKHQVLDMSVYIGPRWSRRDQIVYNFETVKIYELERAMYMDMKPSRDTVIITGDFGMFLLPIYVDDTTFEPTFRFENSIPVRIHDNGSDFREDKLPGLLPAGQSTFYFVEYPFFNNAYKLRYLQSHYRQVEKREYEIDGYKAAYYEFALKQ